MGQIFDRISRIAKAKFSDYSDNLAGVERNADDDDDLKRAIDDLKEQQSGKKKEQSHSAGQESFDTNKKMDIFSAAKILDVSADASFDDVRVAYKKKIKEYHPDKVAALGQELRELAEKKTSEINAAYNFFRQKYSK